MSERAQHEQEQVRSEKYATVALDFAVSRSPADPAQGTAEGNCAEAIRGTHRSPLVEDFRELGEGWLSGYLSLHEGMATGQFVQHVIAPG